MKPRFVTIPAVFLMILAAVWATASTLNTLQIGKDLFYDPTLGGSTNERSCNSCHNRGFGLENLPAGPDLMAAIKQCLAVEMEVSDVDAHLFLKELPVYVISLSRRNSTTAQHSPPDMTGGFRPGGLDAGAARSRQGSGNR